MMNPEDLSLRMFYLLLGGGLGLCAVNLLLTLFLFGTIRAGREKSEAVGKELYGTLKKIEGMLAGRRAQILKEYDKMVQSLSLRLPTVIASNAGDRIFETERNLLQCLAEIDPLIKEENHKEKLDELIRNMESLQDMISSLVTDTVRKVLEEARTEIASDDSAGLT